MGLFENIAIRAAQSIGRKAGKGIAKAGIIGGIAAIAGVSETVLNVSEKADGIKDFWDEKHHYAYLKKFEREAEKYYKQYLPFKSCSPFPNCYFVAHSPQATFFLDENKQSPYSLLQAGNFYFLYSTINNDLVGKFRINDCKKGHRGIDVTNKQATQLIDFYIKERRIGEIQIIKRKHFREEGLIALSVGRIRLKNNPEEKGFVYPKFNEISLDTQGKQTGNYSVIQYENGTTDFINNLVLAYCGYLVAKSLYNDIRL